ncbi:MAG TPA: hypothetical protein ENO00_05255 [Deltaproteobacteria bacterium]|nr:hypothetical protein [Deltaproteobacteria bacterium]
MPHDSNGGSQQVVSNVQKGRVVLFTEEHETKHVHHQFTLRSDRRGDIVKRLDDKNIISALYHPVPLHKQKAFAHRHPSSADLSISDKPAREVLLLSTFSELMREEIHQIHQVINHAF